jgi:hypothetical protein
MQPEKPYNLHKIASLTTARFAFKRGDIMSYHILAMYKQYFFYACFFFISPFYNSIYVRKQKPNTAKDAA